MEELTCSLCGSKIIHGGCYPYPERCFRLERKMPYTDREIRAQQKYGDEVKKVIELSDAKFENQSEHLWLYNIICMMLLTEFTRGCTHELIESIKQMKP